MDFNAEFTQIFLLIVVLLAAYLGIKLWAKRGGVIRLPSAGDDARKASDPAGLIPDEAETQIMGAVRSTGSGRAAERHGDRFNLTGKDAEAAARVLKRMLRQDQEKK